ncbi:MAG: FecR domain-containing protein [Bacteroidota bacterium]
MQKARLAFLFKRYLDHQCTAEEYQELMTLVDLSDDETLQHLLDGAYTGHADQELPNAATDRILNHILENKLVPAPRRTWYWLGGVAASVLLAATIYLGFERNTRQEPAKPQNFVATMRSLNDHRLIKLADGSSVTLNKNSRLTFTKEYNGKLREVTLYGQGYFDVKHDPAKPFLVHAGNLTVTVLGTAFDVDTRNHIAVTVTRGKVSVSDHQKLLASITPNQQFNYDEQNMLAKKITINAAQVVQWQALDLFFDNITMQDAAIILEKRFNKKIRFEHENSKKCVFSASFTHGQNLQQIIKVICTFNNASYQEDDDSITIKGTGC